MCEPTTVLAVLSVASTVMQVQSQRAEGRYKKGISEYNARVSENEAQRTREAGNEAENIQRRKTAQLLAKQRAQLGAANVDVDSGSALQIQQDTITFGEADALRIRSNVDAQVGSLQTGADLIRNQGDFAKSAADAGSAGTLLGGAGKFIDTGVADKWFTPDSAAVTGLGPRSDNQNLFNKPKSNVAGFSFQ